MKYLLLAAFIFVSACRPESTAKKTVDSIPMESVDAETSGRKSGGTHFSLNEERLFLDYEYLDDDRTAQTKIDESGSKGKRILEQANMIGTDGRSIGKLIVVESDSKHPNVRFCLLWTNKNKFTQVCSESTRAIEDFRSTYEL